MSTLDRDQLRRTQGERGASLIIALVFISVFGIMLMAISGFADTNVRATSAYRNQRATNYATNGALDAAVDRVAHDPNIGIDPLWSPTDACNSANDQTMLMQPPTSTTPRIVVSCLVASGSNSGQPAQIGSAPPDALLTLGDRRTSSNDGTVSTLTGVRNTEPPAYNANSDVCQSNTAATQEDGIRQNDTIMPGIWHAFIIFPVPTCGYEPDNYSWNVRGNIFSNSKIQIDSDPDPDHEVSEHNAAPTMLTDPDGVKGTIQARGGCSGTGFGTAETTCTNPGWDFSDNKGRDPGLVTPAEYAPRSLTGLHVFTTGDPTFPTSAQCTNARKLVTFTPGIYTDATALNNLFASPDCRLATFWFTPGTYYFDFRNTTSTSQCGTTSWLDFDPDIAQNTNHQWCIAGAGDDYGAQHVIGGTPYNWAPTADPTSRLITLTSNKAGAGPGQFFGIFPQPTQFTTGDNCANPLTVSDCGKAIDGKTDNYAMGSGKTGSSIWMSDYATDTGAKVPRGSYNGGIDLEIAQAALSGNRMNPPTVQVKYQTVTTFLGQGFKTTGSCPATGAYTLPTPTANPSPSIKLSEVNPAAAVDLSHCLNTGDKINSAVVQYNVNRAQFQDPPYATAKFDGAKILVIATDQPSFGSRPPSETDPGGDCDPEGPGVQFIFGGDSHVYLPNGSMELCAGPDPDPVKALHGKELAVYGVPATPRLVPSSASGGTNPENAKVIAEGAGLAYATMAPNNAMTLSYSGLATPADYSLPTTAGTVMMRVSFDASSPATVALQDASGSAFSGTRCSNVVSNSGTSSPVQTKLIDVTSCLTTSNRLGNAFKVRWQAGTSGSAKLDGVEFIVNFTPTNPNATLRRQNGCVTSSPNYWYGLGTGVSQDCSLLRVDSRFATPTGGIFGGVRQGRLSVKGTIYAPSAAIDIDDTDVWYPIASRGLIARHLRIRGFQYHPGFNDPAFDSYVDDTPSTRQVVFLACRKDTGPCTPTDPSLVGRAAVAFESGSGNPSIQAWSVGKI